MPRWEDTLSINDYTVEASFSSATVEDVIEPLLDRIDLMVENKGSRAVIFLAAPPGAGKTTLAAAIEAHYEEGNRLHWLQAVGIDGFHHTNDYLASHSLADGTVLSQVKGAPESFDLDSLIAKLDELGGNSEVMWPVYSRILHEPVSDGVCVEGDIVLVEGNWLLLDEDGWRDLIDYADFTIMLLADESLVREGLIARKERGGVDHKEALAHYGRCDGPNVRRVLGSSQDADLTLRLIAPGEIIFEGQDIFQKFM